MATLAIDRRLDQPVYEQIADRLRGLVAAGELPPGSALPSVRQLAGDLGVNLNTVARAYRRLEGEGFLVIRERAGVVVAPPAAEAEPAAHEPLVAEIRSAVARLRQAGVPPAEILRLVRSEVLALADGPEGDRP